LVSAQSADDLQNAPEAAPSRALLRTDCAVPTQSPVPGGTFQFAPLEQPTREKRRRRESLFIEVPFLLVRIACNEEPGGAGFVALTMEIAGRLAVGGWRLAVGLAFEGCVLVERVRGRLVGSWGGVWRLRLRLCLPSMVVI
jgi:hypothetical protein